MRTHFHYISLGGYFYFLCAIICFLASNSFSILSSIWLVQWSLDNNDTNALTNYSNVSNYTSSHTSIYWTSTFLCFRVIEIIFQILAFFIFSVLFSIKASSQLHKNIISSLGIAKISFFDATSIGDLLSDLTNDLGYLDTMFSFQYGAKISLSFVLLSCFITVAIGIPYLLIFSPICLFYIFARFKYLKSISIHAKSALMDSKPPISHLVTSFDGVESIISGNLQDQFRNTFYELLDDSTSSTMMTDICRLYFGLRAEFFGGFIQFSAFLSAGILFEYFRPSLSPYFIVTLSYIITLPIVLGQEIFVASGSEASTISLYNLERYETIDMEEDQLSECNGDVDNIILYYTSPTSYGMSIEFCDLYWKYASGNMILQGLSFKIESGEKIGIVGRTGSGKSSIFQSLLRIEPPVSGLIKINDVDSKSLPLKTLRKLISVIPQDPTLFYGSIRFNLDPFLEFEDSQIWHVLSEVQIAESLNQRGLTLESEVNAGKIFSFGEKQLLCAARVLLRDSPIILMDEATSSVDLKTDEIIQGIFEKWFRGRTVLTIAHRVNTLEKYDKILHLDGGKIVDVMVNSRGSGWATTLKSEPFDL